MANQPMPQQRPRTKEEMNALRKEDRRLAQRSIQHSDYEVFDETKRREIIVSYVKFIEDMGFRPVKVFGAPDPERAYSFRAIFEFLKPNTVQINRKHTAFFEARNWSHFSLRAFYHEVLETTEMKSLNDFTRMLRIRIWNIGYTDEEILSALLGYNPALEIKDVVSPEGTLIIPPSEYNSLFFNLNVTGGNQNSSRIIRRQRNQ